jgi:hypothetical protein
VALRGCLKQRLALSAIANEAFAKDSVLMVSKMISGGLRPSPGGSRPGLLIGGRGDGLGGLA